MIAMTLKQLHANLLEQGQEDVKPIYPDMDQPRKEAA
jgi:hypothetical protein